MPTSKLLVNELEPNSGTTISLTSVDGIIGSMGGYRNTASIIAHTTTTIPTGENAIVVGPISVATGIDWSINGTLKVL